MVLTKKFSEFVSVTPATISDDNEKMVGLESGVNMQSTRFLSWTTAGRPPTPFNGLLGLNTDLEQYEWWDAGDAQWFQLEDSGDISELIARLAAHTPGNGASMIGLLDQSNVTSKTVQNLADATFIAQTSNGTLQNAQFLGSLTTGIVKNTTVTGVLSISAPLTSIDGLTTVAHEFLVTTAANTYGTLGPLTNGQLIIGSTGLAPVAASLIAGSGVSITPGAGSITISAMGSGGTVTSFSAGTLSPLFTTSVATATTTPALSFILTNAGANTYFGNATGGVAAPSYTTAGALTKTDDTNVTLTLGGSPTVALLAAASLTLGWTGLLSLARGGTNKNITAVAGAVVWCDADSFELTAAGSAGQLFQSTGTTSPGWTTATFPATAGSSGNVMVSDGTNWSSSSTTGITALGAQAQALNMNNHLINNVTTPVSDLDAANKFYVDQTALNGTSVYAASITNLTVTQSGAGVGATLTNAGAQATFSLDGATPPVGVNVLIKNIGAGGTAANYGIYVVTNAGSGASNWILTRASGYDTTTEINNTGLIIINNGTQAGQAWYNSATIVTVDTTPFVFNRFGTSGTVTSITFTGDGVVLSSTPTAPVTTSGTLTASLNTQTANTVFAGPTSGGAATPTFRALVTADLPAGAGGVNPNIIIGGNFDTNPWQRGVSFTAPGSLDYGPDRFAWFSNGAGVVNFLKTADAPTVAQAGIFSSNCFNVDVTTADASPGVNDAYAVRYRMEGYDWAQIAQRIFTLSFWVKSTKTGIFCVSFSNTNVDRTYVAEYTVNTTNTWEFKTITVSASPSAGTWNYTNLIGLNIFFTIAAGVNYQTTANAWNVTAANLICTANQVNGMDSNSNFFKLQLVKIESGSSATAWQFRSEEEELALCQRYYEKSYNQGIYAGAASSIGGAFANSISTALATTLAIAIPFAVTKRADPTITVYSYVNGTSGNLSQDNNSDIAASTATGQRSFYVSVTNGAARYGMTGHFTASAEL